MEENKAKREDDDMISKLPDTLISEILFYLPTKEAVRTSVLSNRWRSLWLLVPGLDLDSCEFLDFNAFSSFVNKCLDFSRENELCLHKLKLSIHQDENENHNQFCVTRWIDFVAKGKLKHLDVERFLKRKCLEVIMPVSLFVCQTLVYLRLSRVLFSTSFEESSSVSLPRLKTLRLELNVYSNETSLESLISYIPVLEDLTIVRRVGDNVKYLRVRSQTLTSLRIKFQLRRQSEYYGEVDVLVVRGYGQGGFLIDAPRLKYLNIEDERTTIKTITNLGSLNKVNLLGSFFIRGDDQDRKFFTSLSGVRDMNLSRASFLYFMNVVPLPQFCNLYQLEVGLCYFSFFDRLLMFLPSCPKLRSLILNLIGYWGKMSLSSEHLCLLSSLEFVEMECIFRRYPSLELVISNPQDTASTSESEIFHARRKFFRLK
ncbi:unnamed protein product [Arabidopsis lyrata]|nr:putative FBD-associated F-box protein At5g22720 isoform X2 [Arabidopsis lyrata subsp. lyrata]CAH8277899.1 unnamed protein product [Arabidopsis lyrata]|eukprot:XP_020887487.1 putative FBD-associated F-box protein At5g22720 isoform X2 [Arabidopsis lyrata subsp. lyrata]